MTDAEMGRVLLTAIEVHAAEVNGRRRKAARYSLGGAFTRYEWQEATSWNEAHWERLGYPLHGRDAAIAWVGEP